MAKRFTDAGKWRRPWFRELSKDAKLVWGYLCDECDHAGVWIADFGLMSFQLNFKVDAAMLVELLGDKLVQIDHDKFFIPSFFEFQYADAKEGFKAKQSALKILTSFSLIEESTDSLIDLTNSYLSVTGLSPDCLSKSKSISKSKGNTGSAEGAEPRPGASDYEAVYKDYPLKVGKSEGLAKLKRQCTTHADLARFKAAMLAYSADCKAKDRFHKQFDSFVNSKWQDWLDPETGQAPPGESADPMAYLNAIKLPGEGGSHAS